MNSIKWTDFSSFPVAIQFLQFYGFSIGNLFCAFNMRFSVLIRKIKLGA